MLNRLKRLYPTLLVGLTLTVALDAIGMYWFDLPIYRSNQMGYDVVSHFNPALFLANMLSQFIKQVYRIARFSTLYQSIILISIASLVLAYAYLIASKMPNNNSLSGFSKKIVDDLYTIYVSHMPIIFLVLGLMSRYAFEHVLAKVLVAAAICVVSILGLTPIVRAASRVLENAAGKIIAGKSNG